MSGTSLNLVSAEQVDPARRRSLHYFNVFRLILAALFLVIGSPFHLGEEAPVWYWSTAAAWIAIILLLGFPDAEKRLTFNSLVGFQIICDIVALTLIMWSSGGFRSNMSVLLMIVLAGAGLVGEGMMVLFFAALATVCVLTENLWRVYFVIDVNPSRAGVDFFQVGMTCITFFCIAIIARMLALRARANARLAMERGAALVKQEAVNARIIRDMRDGVIVLSRGGVVRLSNPSACALLGFESIEGRVLTDLDPQFASCMDDIRQDYQLLRLGQGRRLLRCRTVDAASGEAEGDILLYLTELEDIQRNMQQSKLVALGRLTASMAHEIRNPLAAVIQAAELMREEKRTNVQERLIRIINDNSRRIESMIRDILALGRREQTLPEALQLAPFVAELFEARGLASAETRAVFTAAIDPQLTLGVDRTHLHQILDNLLINAHRYCSGKPGAVQVSAEMIADGQVRLHVRDDGQGIQEANLAHLFEPFFTTHAKGTGLGLYIARELAEANNITLEYIADGPGAHFVLTGRSQP
ncbi:two-component sensor histidine kinase [Betaproteobacteria bacterium]|nr:two-component sensor histidine kinase [Betaproteobacteria bacterium]